MVRKPQVFQLYAGIIQYHPGNFPERIDQTLHVEGKKKPVFFLLLILLDQDRGVFYLILPVEPDFDFLQFDSIAMDFYLVVLPAQEFAIDVCSPAHQVAGVVEESVKV